MKRKKLFILILFCVALPYQSISQNRNDSPTTKLKNEYQIKLDTLNVQNFTKGANEMRWNDKTNMPYYISFLIALMTIGINIWITVTARKNVEKQIQASLTTSQSQINSSQEIAIKQIENSKELALHEFDATLKSKNRQDWINEVRHCISEYIIQNRMVNIHCQSENSSAESIHAHYEKAGYNFTKILLLLDNEKPDHKKVLDIVNEFSGMIDIQLGNSPHTNGSVIWDDSAKTELRIENHKILNKQKEIEKVTKELLYSQWRKIKNIEKKQQAN